MPTRLCSRCEKNRQERFFRGRGRVCIPCQRKAAAKRAKDRRLQEKYGITHDEYDALLAAQGGRCAMCLGTRPYNLDVDHDHKMEATLVEAGVSLPLATRLSIRGLLCKNCNRKVLRSVRDNKWLLQRALLYLARPYPFARVAQSAEATGSNPGSEGSTPSVGTQRRKAA